MQLWLKSLDAVTSFAAACLSFWEQGGILQHNFFFPLTFGLKHLCHWNVSSERIVIYRGSIKRKVLLGEWKINLQRLRVMTVKKTVNMKDAWNLCLISGVFCSVCSECAEISFIRCCLKWKFTSSILSSLLWCFCTAWRWSLSFCAHGTWVKFLSLISSKYSNNQTCYRKERILHQHSPPALHPWGMSDHLLW